MPGLSGRLEGYTAPDVLVRDAYATGNVSASGSVASGGLVGYSDFGTISQSFATGDVSTGTEATAGGLIGAFANGGGDSSIADSYARGAVTASAGTQVGGFIGRRGTDNPTVATSYSTGLVSGGTTAGGFLGYDYSSSGLSFDDWDIDTSGSSQACGFGSCSGVTGLSDAQLKSGLPAGFDPTIWGQNPTINSGYPYLLANPPPK